MKLTAGGHMSLLDKIREKIRGEKKPSSSQLIGFDPEKHEPVIRSSICTGEQTAGYKDRDSGKFHEVMLINDEADLEEFKRLVQCDDIKIEY